MNDAPPMMDSMAIAAMYAALSHNPGAGLAPIVPPVIMDDSARTDEQLAQDFDTEEKDELKGPWTAEEDEQLKKLVQKHGARNWSVMSKSIAGRTGKSCRLRWVFVLCRSWPPPGHGEAAWVTDLGGAWSRGGSRTSVNDSRSKVSVQRPRVEVQREEDAQILAAHVLYGNKWATIAKLLPGRQVLCWLLLDTAPHAFSHACRHAAPMGTCDGKDDNDDGNAGSDDQHGPCMLMVAPGSHVPAGPTMQ
ncbi:transcription factor, Myb superfamily, partial [Haematococcus lacustris]